MWGNTMGEGMWGQLLRYGSAIPFFRTDFSFLLFSFCYSTGGIFSLRGYERTKLSFLLCNYTSGGNGTIWDKLYRYLFFFLQSSFFHFLSSIFYASGGGPPARARLPAVSVPPRCCCGGGSPFLLSRRRRCLSTVFLLLKLFTDVMLGTVDGGVSSLLMLRPLPPC